MLNRKLYNKLRQKFGKVKISNENRRARFKASKKLENSRDKYWGKVLSSGEEYHVDCPFCDDHRKRLYISYLYGMTIKKGGKKVLFGRGLAWCHNEEHCMNNPHNKKRLWAMIGPKNTMEQIFLSGPGDTTPSTKPVEENNFEFPRNIVRIDKLLDEHKAIKYLKNERGFDVDYLAKKEFGFCLGVTGPLYKASERIIIPVFNKDGDAVGAQARSVGTPDDDNPKYWTIPGSKFNETFYNIRSAIEQDYVVITEGVFDALKVGESGVAILGSSISQKQKFLLSRHWDTIIFLLDADLGEKEEAKYDKLKNLYNTLDRKKNVFWIMLEEGDPGDMRRKELDKLIKGTLHD